MGELTRLQSLFTVAGTNAPLRATSPCPLGNMPLFRHSYLKRENVEKELHRFLRYLEAERGCSSGTIKAYRLDLRRGLIPFVHRRGKSDVSQATTDDIRAFVDFLTFERGNSSAARVRKLAAVKSFF